MLGGAITIGGDLTVGRLGFGAMRLCGPGVWGSPADLVQAAAVLRRAIDRGVTLIDTADAYGPDVNERFIADVLYPYPPELLIATKGGLTRPRQESWIPDGRPEHLRAACEASLKRLRLERIDLYQLHAPDPRVPFADQVGALAALQAEGKIRHIGLSNVGVDQLRQARRIAPIAAVQNRYSVADRSSDPVLAACEAAAIAFLPWRPLTTNDARLLRVARRLGATPTQLSLAWLLARSPVMAPIPGTGSLAHLDENLAAAGLSLSAADRRDLGLGPAGAGAPPPS
jgi:aryl-alcohol dehydrogenase-like predicted oxidoreductase